MAYRIAVASTDGIVVNQHFGHAERFHIIEIDENTYKYSGTREVERVCQGHYHNDSSFDKVIDVLSDVHAVVVAKIGSGASQQLESRGLTVYEAPFPIDRAAHRKNNCRQVVGGGRMAISYEELTDKHPCYARGKKGSTGRIHLPISPTCNIECRFCDRRINDYEKRPGVASTVIKPDEAIDVIKKSLELCPAIKVAGIAGPGDTLASDYALETFRLIKQIFPDLVKCMSTNGLLLAEKADEIIATDIDSLTVTVNAVDPEIEAKLNRGILYHGKHYTGIEAADILITNQLEGIRKVSAAGITIKVNTVLVIGINDEHIEEIAKTVKAAGASIYNIIPLIPQNELKDYPEPTCAQIETVRAKASKYIDVFRHCQRCRADAIGVPGEKDYGDQIYLKRIAHKDTFSHG